MFTLLFYIEVAYVDDVHLCLYHYRLASLSEKRVKQDQSKVEDTLSLNIQSKVEEDFAKFIDEARIDVKIESRHSVNQKRKFTWRYIALD